MITALVQHALVDGLQYALRIVLTDTAQQPALTLAMPSADPVDWSAPSCRTCRNLSSPRLGLS